MSCPGADIFFLCLVVFGVFSVQTTQEVRNAANASAPVHLRPVISSRGGGPVEGEVVNPDASALGRALWKGSP